MNTAGGTQVSDSHQGRLLVVKKFEGPRASANLKQVSTFLCLILT